MSCCRKRALTPVTLKLWVAGFSGCTLCAVKLTVSPATGDWKAALRSLSRVAETLTVASARPAIR